MKKNNGWLIGIIIIVGVILVFIYSKYSNKEVIDNTVLSVLNIEVESSNNSDKYIKKNDTLYIKITFNKLIEDGVKVMVNEEMMSYSLNSFQNYLTFTKTVLDEGSLTLKVLFNDTTLLTYPLPIIDNEIPTCTMKRFGNKLQIIGNDNYGIDGYAISQNDNYTFQKTNILEYNDYGTWYAYVKDYAGNIGSCNLAILKPEIPIYPNNITIIGDSRMEDLCRYSFYKQENGTCIAKVSMGYRWLVDTAAPTVNALNSDQKKYIVTNLGVNDLYNIDRYIAKYQELARSSWMNSMLFIVSVNPTDGRDAGLNGEIDSFNNKLKTSFNGYNNVAYCDTSSYLKQHGFKTGDGTHYNRDTSAVIYEQIKQCIYDYYNK